MDTSEKILKKIGEGRQFRRNDLAPEVRAIGDGINEMIVEGHATTFDQEYLLGSYEDWSGYRVDVWEKVDARAFNDTDMSDVIFLYDHEGRVFARNRNNTLAISTDDFGLFVKANLGGSSLGPGLFEDIKNGYVDRMSMQFTVAEDSREEIRNEEDRTIKVVRTILKVAKLYDVSAVGIPANDGTDISARSFCDGVIAELEAERLKALKRAQDVARLKLRLRIAKGKIENGN